MKRRSRTETIPERLISSGFLVPRYYAAQARARFDEPAAAAVHYLDTGWSLGFLPNPVHDFDGRTLPGPDEVSKDDFIWSTALLPARRHFDLGSYVRLAPQAQHHPGGATGHFLQAALQGQAPFGFTQGPAAAVRSWAQFLALADARGKELATIIRSGLFDRELYEIQTGLSFASPEAACWHYLERGEAAGLLPHPGFHRRLGSNGPNPDESRFARTVRLGELPQPSEDADSARQQVLHHARVTRSAGLLATPRGIPTLGESQRFADRRPGAADERGVTIVARAEDITWIGAGHASTLVQQTHQAWELVLGLDPDAAWRTRMRAARLAALDPRIRVVEVPEQLRTAQVLSEDGAGDLVAVWDGTEQWAPRFLELAAAAINDGAAVTTAVARGTTLPHPDPRAPHDGMIDSVDHLAWSGPRGLRGVLITKPLLAEGPDPLGSTLNGWSLLLRARQLGTVNHVPVLSVAGAETPAPAPALVAEVRARWTSPPAVAPEKHSTTVVMIGVEETEAAELTIRSATEAGHDVVVTADSTAQALDLAAVLYGGPHANVRIIVLPTSTTWGHAASIALSSTHGDACLFVQPGTSITDSAVSRLRSLLSDRDAAVGATMVAADSTIAGGCLIFPGRGAIPHRLLAGHPVEDLPDVETISSPAAEAEGLLLRTGIVTEIGIDPRLDEAWAIPDVTLRATEAGYRVRTAPAVRIVRPSRPQPALHSATPPDWLRRVPAAADEASLLSPRGLVRVGVSVHPDGRGIPVLVRRPHVVESGPARGLPSLRWAIKAPMQPGPRGDAWGDTFFIADLAGALRRLGQDVVIDRRLSHHRPSSSHLDDIVLNIRGLFAYRPQPGATSLLWIISHPDMVTADELDDSVDLAYAASLVWAEHATGEFDRPVHPLLQATDPTRFRPDGASDPHDVVFVGRPKAGQLRPIVRDALDAAIPVEVYGENWDRLIDSARIRGDYVSNERLPEVYRGARVVLTDHHADMAARGFWSNRAFDAAATGTIVVSDQVAGPLPAEFDGLVRSYSTVDELRELLSTDADWPDHAERLAIAELIGREHSFDARARRMLADVFDLRGIEHDLGRTTT